MPVPINAIKEDIFVNALAGIELNKPASKVLDIGCADIRPYSRYLIEHYGSYEGIDMLDEFVEKSRQATKNYKNVTISNQNAEALQFEDNTFDLIVFNDMLQFTNKQVVLSEIYRTLKNDGYAISFFNNTIGYNLYKIIHPNKNPVVEFFHSMVVIFNTALYRLFKIKVFYTTYSHRDEIQHFIEQCGFKKNEFIDIGNRFPYKTISFIARK